VGVDCTYSRPGLLFDRQRRTSAVAGTVGSERQPPGIMNPNDRFRVANPAQQLSRLDPHRSIGVPDSLPESRLPAFHKRAVCRPSLRGAHDLLRRRFRYGQGTTKIRSARALMSVCTIRDTGQPPQCLYPQAMAVSVPTASTTTPSIG
jgi:hypothetical protein